jgi:hypothetical protein
VPHPLALLALSLEGLALRSARQSGLLGAAPFGFKGAIFSRDNETPAIQFDFVCGRGFLW